MSLYINELIYGEALNYHTVEAIEETLGLNRLLRAALHENCSEAWLKLHRTLYSLNMAHLSAAWEARPNHIAHPFLISIKQRIEGLCEEHFLNKQANTHATLFSKPVKLETLVDYIQAHPASQEHELYVFLQNEASIEQMREVLFQESPIQMLFGDILACLLPGVYGSIKMEILKNYWDELGNGDPNTIHRNLRTILMKKVGLSEYCYRDDAHELILEELQLINLYLSLATNRARHTELIGVFLATELAVVNYFEYQVQGWRRLGFQDEDLIYFDMHIALDSEHSEDWINKVVKPMVDQHPGTLDAIAMGAIRRLTCRQAVINTLYDKIKTGVSHHEKIAL